MVDGDHEVTSRVTIIAAPGEPPDHSIVHVVSAGDHFYYLGDLYHQTYEVAHLKWLMTQRDTPVMMASRPRLIDDAVPRIATLVFTHNIFSVWSHIVATEAGQRGDDV